MANGLGGFTPDGREYVMTLRHDVETPAPWVNVLANPSFGSLVTASGASFTWSGNSRQNRLTPFANDPTADPTAEAIFVRDDETGEVWGATPGPLSRTPDAAWLVRHRAGVSTFERATHDLRQQLDVFVLAAEPVKASMLTITNTSDRARRLSLFSYSEWLLGPPRMGHQAHVVTSRDAPTGAIVARNTYNADFPGRLAFTWTSEPVRSLSGDRTEFLGTQRHARAAGGSDARGAVQSTGRPGSTPAACCTSASCWPRGSDGASRSCSAKADQSTRSMR